MVNHKIFRDNVHGYIRIPSDIVRLFIDTEIFQRLRNIEQTGMRILFPSARHDRFIHSLGTFYLGDIAFTNFRANAKENSDHQDDLKRKHYNIVDNDQENEAFWDKIGTLFKIACLLHDCGHAPFSHTLEFIYEYPSSITPLKDKLLQYISSTNFKSDFSINKGSQHERMSALVICTEYRKNVEDLLTERNLSIIDVSDDIEFIVRMIIGCKYQRDSKANRIKNCLVSLLNSNSIDVDSLDYIIRDSKLSGIDNMSVDVNRLLSSLTIVEKTVFKRKKVSDANISTNILNGVLEKTTDRKAILNGKYQGIARIKSFDGKMTGTISARGHFAISQNVTFIPSNDNILRIGTVSHTDTHIIPSTANEVDVEILGTTGANFQMAGTSLDLEKEYNGQLSCRADIIHIDSAFFNGKITGFFTGELLGYYEDIGGTLTCELGFHKSSLSVIQNVLLARNYEYQWIYSHHKVVYFSNYLIIELLHKSVKFLLEKDDKNPNDYEAVWTSILSWENMIKGEDEKYHPYEFSGNEYFRPVDCDILSLFRKCRNICIKQDDNSSDISRLLNEFYTRIYKKSLWKSFAEYSIFFSFLSENEKRQLYHLILANSFDRVIDQYGYFNADWESEFIRFGLKNVVWVNANSKLKALNPDNTCILFKDTTLNYRTVSLAQDLHIEQKMNFFYIYYESVDNAVDIDIIGIKQFIHEKLKRFL